METATVGRVLTEAKIENLEDLWAVKRGLIPAGEERSIVVDDALVDTGATMLSMPTSLIERLGLVQFGTKRMRTSAGLVDARLFEVVQLTIQGRDCRIDVLEVPDGTPVLIGQVPLELLDFVVDMTSHRLTGNPRHGGEHMFEQY
jgi:predicted aspartyl protease